MSDFLERASKLTQKQLALLASQLQSRLEAANKQQREPIAVIGMGCRFPGGADSPQAFWNLLQEGFDGIRETPSTKWDQEQLFDPNADAPGKMSTRWGGFLDNLDQFDPQIFGISPREAASMDPQQRLLLEVTWEALEYAAQSPDKLLGSSTGVFVGISGSDYFQLMLQEGYEKIDAYLASGSAHSIAAGRLSYVLGAQGPSVAVDTACSSSLVAIHLAVQSLRSNECSLAIAGGVNVILSPETTITLSKAHMMASDGRCKAFDTRADGFVRSEGCGIIILKRLSEAQKDGDNILAVIRGTAINQDGRSNGLTAPNGPSQEAVIQAALRNAGLQANQVSYIETHGTGTSLGDPIEVQALGAVYCQDRNTPLKLGSVKTNIGHLESAAGIAGFIKVVLALMNRTIPPHLHLQERNPYIPWEDYPTLEIPTERTAWEMENGSLLAGLSSFGFSGTNAHLIIGEAPKQEFDRAVNTRDWHLFTLSSASPDGLIDLTQRYSDWLGKSQFSIADLCFTVNTGRAHLPHRLGILAQDAAEILEKLAQFQGNKAATDLFRGLAKSTRQPPVAFLFTGQGAQYAGMGQQLYETQPVFRDSLIRCDEILRPYLDHPLLEIIFSNEAASAELLNDTTYTQPALFSMEYSLAQLWESWGIRPSITMGHSVGEYVAACIAGVFSLEDGLKLIAERGKLIGSLPRGGQMAAVFAGEEQIRTLIAPYSSEVSIAALNGPDNVVISGSGQIVAQITTDLSAQGIISRPLTVSHAFHSPLMDPILQDFRRVAQTIQYFPPKIEIISNVTGEVSAASEIASADYWVRHIRQPVRFFEALKLLDERGYQHFLEIGPHPVLLGMGQRCVPENKGAWLASLKKGQPDWKQLLESLVRFYVQGFKINWDAVDQPYAARKIVLPTYPFQRERYWEVSDRASRAGKRAALSLQESGHPLLGGRLRTASRTETTFESQISAQLAPYLEDHRIFEKLVLPSPVYIEMALAAAGQIFGPGAHTIENMVIHEAVVLPDEGAETFQLVISHKTNKHAAYQIYRLNENDWIMHVSGHLRSGSSLAQPSGAVETIAAIQERCQEEVSVPELYARLQNLGLTFKPRFQAAQNIIRTDWEALGYMQLQDSLTGEAQRFSRIHPALLDACLHVLLAAIPDAATTSQDTYLLIGLDRLRFYQPTPARFWNHVRIHMDESKLGASSPPESISADITLIDDENRRIAELTGVRLKRAKPAWLFRQLKPQIDELLYEPAWIEKPHPLPFAGQASPEPSINPVEISENIRRAVTALSKKYHLGLYDEMLPQLDRLCSAHILQALHQLGWKFSPGERLNADHWIGELGILERHRKLVNRILAILTEDGLLQNTGDVWEVTRRPVLEEPQALFDKAYAAYPMFDAELNLTHHCAQSLAGVLTGKVDPLQVLFPGGSLSQTEKLYQDSPFAQAFNSMVRDTVLGVVEQYPANKPVKILELGAGTGGTTSYILAALPARRIEAYVFTDISPLFTANAKEKFTSYPYLHFETLDISREPIKQGFEAQQFDIILAANVLHATPDLRHTLANVKKLLAPGGALILLEANVPERFADLTVGLTEGWWLFSDADLRSDYALLSQPKWLQLLEEMGFSQAVAIPGESSQGIFSRQAIILGTNSLAPAEDGVHEQGSWLILEDHTGVAATIREQFEERGDVCIRVTTGDQFIRLDNATYQVNPERPEDFKNLLAQISDQGNPTIKDVLHLWSLDARLDKNSPVDALDETQLQSSGSLLHLVQALVNASDSMKARLWIITSGAQAVAGQNHPLSIAQSTTWGLSHSIEIEHPEIECTRIDLDPQQQTEEQVNKLIHDLQRPEPGENQIAYRQNIRYTRRLKRRVSVPGESEFQAKFDPQASYLITGGLGGLGLVTAEWMAQRGARQLILMGRSGLSPQKQDAIARIEQAGAEVRIVRCDVSNFADLAKTLAELNNSMPPLRGILHAAGVLDDGVIIHQSWERFKKVMAPKVLGTWNLHALTLDMQLDFFILFSSGASLVGSAGQSNHAAANSFLDAFAHYRQGQGETAVSINWGAWGTVGAAAERNLSDYKDIDTFSPQQGLSALERALITDAQTGLPRVAQFGVLAVDWHKYLAQYQPGAIPPLYRQMSQDLDRQTQPETVTAFETGPDLRQQLSSSPLKKRRSLLQAAVRERVAKVLRIKNPEQIDVQQSLSELGLDSLMAVELRNELGLLSGQSLPATLVFEYPTIKALVSYLADEVFQIDPKRTADEAETISSLPAETTADNLDDLSEEEIAAMLISKLDSLSLNK